MDHFREFLWGRWAPSKAPACCGPWNSWSDLGDDDTEPDVWNLGTNVGTIFAFLSSFFTFTICWEVFFKKTLPQFWFEMYLVSFPMTVGSLGGWDMLCWGSLLFQGSTITDFQRVCLWWIHHDSDSKNLDFCDVWRYFVLRIYSNIHTFPMPVSEDCSTIALAFRIRNRVIFYRSETEIV